MQINGKPFTISLTPSKSLNNSLSLLITITEIPRFSIILHKFEIVNNKSIFMTQISVVLSYYLKKALFFLNFWCKKWVVQRWQKANLYSYDLIKYIYSISLRVGCDIMVLRLYFAWRSIQLNKNPPENRWIDCEIYAFKDKGYAFFDFKANSVFAISSCAFSKRQTK